MGSELKHLEELPLAERIQLVEDLWDSIARTNGEDLLVRDWQKAELERRKRKYAQSPESARPWSEYICEICGWFAGTFRCAIGQLPQPTQLVL